MNRLKLEIKSKLTMSGYTPSEVGKRYFEEVVSEASKTVLNQMNCSVKMYPRRITGLDTVRRTEAQKLALASKQIISRDLTLAKHALQRLRYVMKHSEELPSYRTFQYMSQAIRLLGYKPKSISEALMALIKNQVAHCKAIIKSSSQTRTASLLY